MILWHNDSFNDSLTISKGLHALIGKGEFFKLYIGLDVEFASRKEQRIISRKPTFRKMPVYPYYGSIRKIGNYMVVKLEQI